MRLPPPVGHDVIVRLAATALTLIVTYVVAGAVIGVVADGTTSPLRHLIAIVAGALAAAAVYTAVKDGPRSPPGPLPPQPPPPVAAFASVPIGTSGRRLGLHWGTPAVPLGSHTRPDVGQRQHHRLLDGRNNFSGPEAKLCH